MRPTKSWTMRRSINDGCELVKSAQSRETNNALRPKSISVVTSARSDFGLLLPLMEAIEAHASFELSVLATGAHFLEDYGHTISEVRESSVREQVVELPAGTESNDGSGTGRAIGSGTIVFADHFADQQPDLVIILGDRFDALPAALAALPCQIPVAHISGGELTEGVIDDYVRHVLTKLSHLHFTATDEYARRVIQLGEEPERVFNVGEPGLDAIRHMNFLDRNEFFDRIGLTADLPLSLFTYHPETSTLENNRQRIRVILQAATSIAGQILFTYPNGDAGSEDIVAALRTFCAVRPTAKIVPSLGRQLYLNALKQTDCVVGNSSSGIVETASFKVPAVNIGDRQKGRVQPANVINSDYECENIKAAWDKALSATFRKTIGNIPNPYGDGRTVERILSCLEVSLSDNALWHKRFHTLGGGDRNRAASDAG